MTKQATHVQPNKTGRIQIIVCDLGGFLIAAGSRDDFGLSAQAAFTNADECADRVRSFLRNQTAEMFGAKKSSKA